MSKLTTCTCDVHIEFNDYNTTVYAFNLHVASYRHFPAVLTSSIELLKQETLLFAKNQQ